MGAARRSRARAQRKRASHSQMAGRNGGFADPREIMAYHNKGELSDAATIQALSLFGIGNVSAQGMLSGSHRARQQSALMGARRQQASFRSMGSHNGSPATTQLIAATDRNGGNWQIELEFIGAHVGMGQVTKWKVRSLDATNSVWMKNGSGMNSGEAKEAAQTAIESLVEDVVDQDFTVDEFGENFEDALGNWWSLNYSIQYTGGVITWVNWTVSSITLNLSHTGQAETKAASRVAALNAVDAWVATQQAENDGGGDATGNGNSSDNGGNGSTYTPADISNLNFADVYAVKTAFLAGSITYAQAFNYIQANFAAILYSQTDIDDFLFIETNYTYIHPGIPETEVTKNDWLLQNNNMAGIDKYYKTGYGSSTWNILIIKHTDTGGEKFRWVATSVNFPEANLSSEPGYYRQDVESAKQQAISEINWRVDNYFSSQEILVAEDYYDDDEDTGGNGGNGGNGGDTGETIDLSDYTSAQEIIDGFNLGVIGYRDAYNALVDQFSYSDNDASEALRTESSTNEWIDFETDGDSFRETGVDVTQPVVVQQAETVSVPRDRGFDMPSGPVLAGGVILVAGAAAVAYTSRRN